MKKRRTFKVWIVTRAADWVYVERERGEALRSINRPAGERVEEGTLTVAPHRKAQRKKKAPTK